jgi:hypothetical protein
MEQVYPQREGFQVADPNPLAIVDPDAANTTRPIPDALLGEGWTIVSLSVRSICLCKDWSIDFGELFDLGQLAADTVIPGLIIYSRRAKPLAAWMAGVDPVFIKFERQ